MPNTGPNEKNKNALYLIELMQPSKISLDNWQ